MDDRRGALGRDGEPLLQRRDHVRPVRDPISRKSGGEKGTKSCRIRNRRISPGTKARFPVRTGKPGWASAVARSGSRASRVRESPTTNSAHQHDRAAQVGAPQQMAVVPPPDRQTAHQLQRRAEQQGRDRHDQPDKAENDRRQGAIKRVEHRDLEIEMVGPCHDAPAEGAGGCAERHGPAGIDPPIK